MGWNSWTIERVFHARSYSLFSEFANKLATLIFFCPQSLLLSFSSVNQLVLDFAWNKTQPRALTHKSLIRINKSWFQEFQFVESKYDWIRCAVIYSSRIPLRPSSLSISLTCLELISVQISKHMFRGRAHAVSEQYLRYKWRRFTQNQLWWAAYWVLSIFIVVIYTTHSRGVLKLVLVYPHHNT